MAWKLSTELNDRWESMGKTRNDWFEMSNMNDDIKQELEKKRETSVQEIRWDNFPCHTKFEFSFGKKEDVNKKNE